MKTSVREIAALVGGRVVGDPDVAVTGFAGIDRAAPGHVTFVALPKWQPLLNNLDLLQQATIEKDGMVIATRTHGTGQVGNVFKATGVALPKSPDVHPVG